MWSPATVNQRHQHMRLTGWVAATKPQKAAARHMLLSRTAITNNQKLNNNKLVHLLWPCKKRKKTFLCHDRFLRGAGSGYQKLPSLLYSLVARGRDPRVHDRRSALTAPLRRSWRRRGGVELVGCERRWRSSKVQVLVLHVERMAWLFQLLHLSTTASYSDDSTATCTVCRAGGRVAGVTFMAETLMSLRGCHVGTVYSYAHVTWTAEKPLSCGKAAYMPVRSYFLGYIYCSFLALTHTHTKIHHACLDSHAKDNSQVRTAKCTCGEVAELHFSSECSSRAQAASACPTRNHISWFCRHSRNNCVFDKFIYFNKEEYK